MKKLFLLLPVVLVACTQVSYIGDSYAPTSQVDIFFDEIDIEYEYKVMGHVDASAADWVDTEKIMDAIKKKAMEKGADAILILGLEQNVVSETTTYSGESVADGNKVKESGSSTTSTSKVHEVKAMFIKYKTPKQKLKTEDE